jgi:hypothetical protein
MYILADVMLLLQDHDIPPRSVYQTQLRHKDIEDNHIQTQPGTHTATLKTPVAGHANAVRCALLQITRPGVMHNAQPRA